MTIPEALKKLRGTLGWSQHRLATELRRTPTTIARWEMGIRTPSKELLEKMAALCTGDLSKFFAVRAGAPAAHSRQAAAVMDASWPNIELLTTDQWKPGTEDRLNLQAQVPVFADAAAAGSGRVIHEKDIESFVAVPLRYAPKGPGKYFGLYVRGDSMRPVLADRFIVVVDPQITNPSRLRGKIVAARTDDGVIIKRLAPESKKARLIFRSYNPEYEDIVIENPETTPIIGQIVFWWGFPELEEK